MSEYWKAFFFNFFKFIKIQSCNSATDYLKIYDGFQNYIFCGSTNYPRLLFESRSNWVALALYTTVVPGSSLIKGGFQVFIESKEISLKYQEYY